MSVPDGERLSERLAARVRALEEGELGAGLVRPGSRTGCDPVRVPAGLLQLVDQVRVSEVLAALLVRLQQERVDGRVPLERVRSVQRRRVQHDRAERLHGDVRSDGPLEPSVVPVVLNDALEVACQILVQVLHVQSARAAQRVAQPVKAVDFISKNEMKSTAESRMLRRAGISLSKASEL